MDCDPARIDGILDKELSQIDLADLKKAAPLLRKNFQDWSSKLKKYEMQLSITIASYSSLSVSF